MVLNNFQSTCVRNILDLSILSVSGCVQLWSISGVESVKICHFQISNSARMIFAPTPSTSTFFTFIVHVFLRLIVKHTYSFISLRSSSSYILYTKQYLFLTPV